VIKLCSQIPRTIFRSSSIVSRTPSMSLSPFQITPRRHKFRGGNKNQRSERNREQNLKGKIPKKMGENGITNRRPSQSKRKASTESTRDRAASAVRRPQGGSESPLAMAASSLLRGCSLLRWFWNWMRKCEYSLPCRLQYAKADDRFALV
jgi:hypothetical protein